MPDPARVVAAARRFVEFGPAPGPLRVAEAQAELRECRDRVTVYYENEDRPDSAVPLYYFVKPGTPDA